MKNTNKGKKALWVILLTKFALFYSLQILAISLFFTNITIPLLFVILWYNFSKFVEDLFEDDYIEYMESIVDFIVERYNSTLDD